MSLNSGIRTSPALAALFAAADADAERRTRAIRVVVDAEAGQLVSTDTVDSGGQGFEADFAAIAPFYASPTAPCFVLVRLDVAGGGWLLVLYVPDAARVRDKMLYASCRAALVRDLGDNLFVDSIHATTQYECSLEGYRAHERHKAADAPLTDKEQDAAALKLTETGADIGASTRREIAVGGGGGGSGGGVGFAFSEAASSAVSSLATHDTGASNLVVLTIDAASETIELAAAAHDASAFSGFAQFVSDVEPYFLLFKYTHEYEGVPQEPVLFFYICPPRSKVKARMLFSSSRSTTLDHIEKQLGIAIAKKIELDSVSEIDQVLIDEALHPPQVDPPTPARMAFKKPSRPGRK